jgi:choline-glycine betaine transporter
LFIARISRGRTVREVAFTGIVATSAATIPWFTIIGGSAVWAQHNGVAEILGPVNEHGASVAGFALFEAFPMGSLLMIAFMILVTTFFITSADSSTLAVSMMTTGGKARPSSINRIFWGVVLGITAAILMTLGGVSALQSAAIITGAPFAFVCFVAMLGLIKEFSSEFGRVMLQDQTTLVGSPDAADQPGTPSKPTTPEDDD